MSASFPTQLARQIRTTLRRQRSFPTLLQFASDPCWLGLTLFPRQALLLRLLGQPAKRWPAAQRENLTCLVRHRTPAAGLWLPPDWGLRDDGSPEPGSPITTLVCVMGRRASKTTLAAIIEAYEVVRHIAGGRQVRPAGIQPGQEIAFLNCATSEEQATVHYRLLLHYLRQLDILPVTGSIDRGLSCLLPSQVRLLSLHSNARSLRGRTAKVVVFDELAHFQQTGGPTSDEEVWRALAPSVRTFGAEGRVLVTSSPAGASGVLWDLFSQRGRLPGLLVAQLATWECNPHIRKADLAAEFQAHPAWAASEYGAQFAEASPQCFLPAELIRSVVVGSPVPVEALLPRRRYALHLDVGLVHDASVLAIAHVEDDGAGARAVIDTCLTWQGSRDAPVSLSLIEELIHDIATRVPVLGISADPFDSALLLERLAFAGLPTRALPFSGPAKVRLYARLEDWLRTGRLLLPALPPLLAELAALERQPSPGGPRYHAPSRGPVTTDDYADAIAGVLEWLAPLVDAPNPRPIRWLPGEWSSAGGAGA